MLELGAVSIPFEATFILAFCRHLYGTQHHSTLSQWETVFIICLCNSNSVHTKQSYSTMKMLYFLCFLT